MWSVLLYKLLFFGIPAIVLVLFVVSLVRYVVAKRKNKKMPGSFSDSEIKKRQIMLIVLSVIVGVFVVVVVGFIALMFMAVAYM